jgi:hypothetical protein
MPMGIEVWRWTSREKQEIEGERGTGGAETRRHGESSWMRHGAQAISMETKHEARSEKRETRDEKGESAG